MTPCIYPFLKKFRIKEKSTKYTNVPKPAHTKMMKHGHRNLPRCEALSALGRCGVHQSRGPSVPRNIADSAVQV